MCIAENSSSTPPAANNSKQRLYELIERFHGTLSDFTRSARAGDLEMIEAFEDLGLSARELRSAKVQLTERHKARIVKCALGFRE